MVISRAESLEPVRNLSLRLAADEAEETRLDALHDLNLLDTPSSESYDRITRLASRILRTPMAAISITDRHRQWFKSRLGFPHAEVPRFGSPCSEITRTGDLLVVPDLLENEEFRNGAMARAGIRFYAGAPLVTRDGLTLGSICALDHQPRHASLDETLCLHDLAALVMSQVALQHDLGRIEPVSGLPNRTQMLEDLTDEAMQAEGNQRIAVLIDLADPREMNKRLGVLGTIYLDDVIRAGRAAIREIVGRKTKLYLVKTMSFLALLNPAQGDSWPELVQRLCIRLKAPILCGGIPVPVAAAIGVAPFRLSDVAPRDVIRTAMSAACEAREGELDFALYDPASDGANRRRFALLSDVPAGLDEVGQFALAFQPRIDVRTGVCASAEALLRWNHPLFGAVSPAEFIPLVEETALARPITRWVIQRALTQLSEWRDQGLDIRVSVNISARNLEEEDFVDGLREAFQTCPIPTSLLELEFTESALIRNRARVITQLEQIRNMGIELAIDDFGSCYSTFSYLHKLPATIVKLDQSFMATLDDSSKDRTLVRSIITMAHDMGYRVVAEGVETAEQYRFLETSGCDEVQGFFFSRPLAVPQFVDWLANRPDRSVPSMLSLLDQAHPPQ